MGKNRTNKNRNVNTNTNQQPVGGFEVIRPGGQTPPAQPTIQNINEQTNNYVLSQQGLINKLNLLQSERRDAWEYARTNRYITDKEVEEAKLSGDTSKLEQKIEETINELAEQYNQQTQTTPTLNTLLR